jgi:hypothetical protein
VITVPSPVLSRVRLGRAADAVVAEADADEVALRGGSQRR